MNLSRSAPLIDSFPSFQHLNNITNFRKALADAGRHWGLTFDIANRSVELEGYIRHREISFNAGYRTTTTFDRIATKTAAERLHIAPSQHTEDAFKRILGGCTSVVEGLGTLRNKIGDAHGKGGKPVRAAPRHAQLAVNLAGAMATFIVETWIAQKK
jgi:hypothetical protein